MGLSKFFRWSLIWGALLWSTPCLAYNIATPLEEPSEAELASGIVMANSLTMGAQRPADLDALWNRQPASALRDTLSEPYCYPYLNPMRCTLQRSLPLMVLASLYNINNRTAQETRNSLLANFRNDYDTPLQFVPLGLQVGLHALGVKGRSPTMIEMLSADALSTFISVGIVTASKNLLRVRRPDGSAYNSFPSGHTAMAFASAAMLHHEYGERYPLLSALAYLSATGTGIGRVLNNRHWVGDVVAGGALGMTSVELAYWLNDRLWKRGAYRTHREELGSRRGFFIGLPNYVGFAKGVMSRQLGVSLRWGYADEGYYAFAHLMLERNEVKPPAVSVPFVHEDLLVLNSYSQFGWGREWAIPSRWISVDTGASLGLEHHDRGILLGLHLSPRFHLTRTVVLSLDAQYQHSTLRRNTLLLGDRTYAYRRPNFVFGTAIAWRM